MAAKGFILCCLCGVEIVPNEIAMCMPCLMVQENKDKKGSMRSKEGNPINTKDELNEVIQCSECERWQVNKLESAQWLHYEWESSKFLSFLLRRVPGLSRQAKLDIKILHAAFVWTEPHSRY